MKKYIFTSIFLVVCTIVQAQYHLKDMSEETKKHFFDAKNCWTNTEETCIPFYKKFVATAKSKNECLPCAEIELARGYFFENYLDSCLTVLDKVLLQTPKLKDTLKLRIELDVYNLKGSSLNRIGKQQEAIKAYMDCGERIEKLQLKEQSALLNVNLGLMYLDMDDCSKAIALFKSALKTLNNIGVTRQTAIINRNLANAYLANNQVDSMLQILPKTLRLAKEQKSINTEIAVYSKYAQAYETKYPDSALYYANEAINLADISNRSREKAGAVFSKANVLINQGNYLQAKPLYIESIKLYTKTNGAPVIRRLYRQLGTSAYKNNDFETAAKYLNLHTQVSDSIADVKTRKMVNELNLKFETEKKEKQIAEQTLEIQKQQANLLYALLGGGLLISLFGGIFIYNRKNQKLKLQRLQQEKENAILNSFIQGEERERNRISHELHDGVAAMIGAAKMNLESLPHLPAKKQQELLQHVNNILENTHVDVRQIAHNLLPVTLEQEGIIEATKHFVSEINQSKLVHFSVTDQNSQATQFPQKTQLILFRIIQELVNNIIKHSQAQNANIVFTKKDDKLTIEISDDGIGFDEEPAKSSQGLYGIKQRLQSINGNFSIFNIEKKGVKAIVELKMD
ncbi:MAG: histidine kinase [Xanthomarina gelatinilytica]|uniref:tetratricopeptide repeat-containing sensor histidine kinase n=1 Tax=Xanthomarina gelatinilytica TaxID=1137281 RepID=UPI003A8BC496